MKLDLLYEIAQTPTEGKLFEVRPLEIDRRSYFGEPMSDKMQERTRHLINDAFAEVDKHPEKYAEPFYTLIPNGEDEGYETVEDLEKHANDLGGKIADWVEQALEWAQRIFNGEHWESICNDYDNAKLLRMIIWKDGFYRLVGGSCDNYYPASDVDVCIFKPSHRIDDTVPLVRLEKVIETGGKQT